jgi:hypothetical protein
MTIPTDIGASFRVRAPEVYERGRAHATKIEARLGASLVAPSAATFKLLSPTGSTVSTASVTITGSVATATVSAGDLPDTLAFGPGYVEEWTLTIAGVAQIARKDAWLARRALHCPVTQADLEQLHPALGASVRSGSNSVQSQIDSVWADTLGSLYAAGQWPARILEPSTLTRYVRNRALAAVFRSFMVGNAQPGSNNGELAAYYDGEADRAWGAIQYLADDDQDGVADSDERGGPGGPIARSLPPDWTGRRLTYRSRVL